MSERFKNATQSIAERRQNLFSQLRAQPSGWEWCRKLSALHDELWRELWNDITQEFPDLPPLSIVATGGYGRQEMSPSSDIDVALIPLAESPELDQAIRVLFRNAHDAFGRVLGVRLSYVYRLAADLPGLDSISLTGFLDARLIAGSSAPYQNFQESLWHDFPTAEFLNAKLEERCAETERTHTTPLVTQPNLKHGAGGLRDFHCYNWIGLAIGERAIPPTSAANQLLLYRNLLHLLSGKLQDDLNFARRDEVAEALQTDPFVLGSAIAEALTQNHNDFLHGLRRLTDNRYSLGQIADAARGEIRIKAEAPAGQTAALLAQAKTIGLELPNQLPALNPQVGPEILSALTSPTATLRAIESTGIFEIIFPELATCKSLMPGDASHRYTVLEHTFQAIEEFERIGPGSPFVEIRNELADPNLPSLALLFHDLGKAIPDGHHQDTGAIIVSDVADRWSLESSLKFNLSWLVKNHLLMSQYIRVRDIDHPDTITEFAALVPNLELLRALTLLTYCDVRSVSPELWTPVQQTYLLSLYERAAPIIDSKENPSEVESSAISRVLSTARSTGTTSIRDIEEFLSAMPTRYLLSTSEETILIHHQLYNQVESETILVTFQDHRELGLTEITLVTPDRPGSLLNILATLYAHNLSIQNLRCATSETNPAIIIDSFFVSKAGSILPHHLRQRLDLDFRRVLKGEITATELLHSKGKDPDRKQQFFTLEITEKNPLILEIRAPRGRGLAYRLAKVISEQGLSILTARLGQWAGSASAGFYVIHPDDQPINIPSLREAFLSPAD